MDLFLGIGDMSIYNFDKVLKTNNMSYMVVGWNERAEIEPPKKAQERWNEIYNDYCKKTANNEALTFYSLSAEIGYLEMRYTVLAHLIYGLSKANKKEFGKEINAWGVPFNIDGDIEKQFPQLKRQLAIANQNLRMKTRKLESLKKEDDLEETSVLAQYLRLEKITGIKTDIRKDSVEKGIELHQLAKEIIAQQNKVKNG